MITRLLTFCLCLTWAGSLQAAIRTSTATGNLSANGTWVGNVAPVAGDQIVVASPHVVTVDTSLSLGTSPPQTPTTLLTIANTGAAATNLPTGTYLMRYTNVDAGGGESHISAQTSTGALTNGVSLPRVTFPALPSGVSSRKLYLTNTGGAAGSEHLYATGITGTTYDLVSASWADGTVVYASAAAWVDQIAVRVNAGGKLTFSGSSVTLTLKGDGILGNTSGSSELQGAADGVIEFDPGSANSPANTQYVLWFGDTNNFASNFAKLTTTGTSAAHPFFVQSKSGAAKNARLAIGLGQFGVFSDAISFNGNPAYVNATRLGDSTSDALQFQDNTVVQKLDHWIFDSGGRTRVLSAPPATAGWDFENVTWKNGSYAASPSGTGRLAPLVLTATTDLSSGTRTVNACVFDGPPLLAARTSTYTNNIFYQGWDTPLNTVSNWTTFDSNLVRWNFQGGNEVFIVGSFTNNIFIGDTAPTVAANGSGTATSATSTTLVDSTKSGIWTLNQYQAQSTPNATGNNPGNRGWLVLITGGTGVGQVRSILSNTTTGSLTVLRAWDTTPDATSTYGLYEGPSNPHYLSANASPSGSTFNVTGNIVFGAFADNNGDCFLHFGSASSTYNIKTNLILPNLARDNSGTFVTLGNENTQSYFIEHNTYFTGGQTFQVSEGAAEAAGVVKTLKSNLAWAEPGVTSYPLAGQGGGSNAFDKLKVRDVSTTFNSTPASATQDILLVSAGVSQADYNGGYGSSKAGYADTQHPGGKGGYDVNSSVTMGTNDIDPAQDPNFVDRWANPITWGESLGVTGDKLTVLATTLTNLRALNDRTGFDARFTVSALAAYLQAKQAPRNVAYRNAGHDGVTVGAVAFAASGRPGLTLIGIGQ